MDLIKTKALVLRSTSYGDYDKILTLLGETTGKISIIAKGGKSLKHGAACNNFCYSDFIISSKSNRYTLSQVSPIEAFSGLSSDLDKLETVASMVKFTEYVCPENEPHPDILRTLLNTLYALANLSLDVTKSKAVFYYKMLELLGFSPELFSCSACGESEKMSYFSVEYGGSLCENCAKAVIDKFLVTPEILGVMNYISTCDIKKLFSFNASDVALSSVFSVAKEFIKHYLDYDIVKNA